MTDLTDKQMIHLNKLIVKVFTYPEIQESIKEMLKTEKRRLDIDLDKIKEKEPELAEQIIKKPLQVIPIFTTILNEDVKIIKGETIQTKTYNKKDNNYKVNFIGKLGLNILTPRGLKAELSNQYVTVQGIVTKVSLENAQLEYSTPYCESTYIEPMTITTDLEHTQLEWGIENKRDEYNILFLLKIFITILQLLNMDIVNLETNKRFVYNLKNLLLWVNYLNLLLLFLRMILLIK